MQEGMRICVTDEETGVAKEAEIIVVKCLSCGETGWKCPHGCGSAPCDHGFFGTIQHSQDCPGPVVYYHDDGSVSWIDKSMSGDPKDCVAHNGKSQHTTIAHCTCRKGKSMSSLRY